MRGVAGKKAYTVHTINIISQLQYFVTRSSGNSVGIVPDNRLDNQATGC